MSRTWRLVAVGVVFAALFAVLTLRLWYLQVSTVATAQEVAEQQQLRVVSIEAPRGDIYDRSGQELLAGSFASRRIVVDRALLPEEREEELVNNLSALLGMPAQDIWALFEENGPGSRFAVGDEVSESTAVFALEHTEDFPGVVVEAVPVRIYPLGEVAAHVLGYIGAPADDDLLRPEITARDRVGRFGIEKEYDRLLRGTPGKTTYRVNASGEILEIVEEVPPQAGGTAITTLDLGLQQFVEQVLLDGMSLARLDGKSPARASAVVIDPRDGSVLAMASVPAYDPGLFSDGRITDEEWAALSETAALNNFAIQGLYPPASAFKVVAYTLALEREIYPTVEQDQYAALLDPNDPTSFYADGDLEFPNTPLLQDWKVHGLVNIHTSLQVSSDNYYWGIALEIWDRAGLDWDEDLLQVWARTLGFGEATGIDLPFEQVGIVPDREWFQYHQLNRTGLVRFDGPWSGGDLMNTAIGQGAMVCTPLQLANAYAALVNGGTLWTHGSCRRSSIRRGRPSSSTRPGSCERSTSRRARWPACWPTCTGWWLRRAAPPTRPSWVSATASGRSAARPGPPRSAWPACAWWSIASSGPRAAKPSWSSAWPSCSRHRPRRSGPDSTPRMRSSSWPTRSRKRPPPLSRSAAGSSPGSRSRRFRRWTPPGSSGWRPSTSRSTWWRS